jgi:small subunit ribosomal protein S8e
MSQFKKQHHGKSNTKSSGNGKKRLKFRDKRRSESGDYFVATKLAEANTSTKIRRKGGAYGIKLKAAAFANVLTTSGFKKAKITRVVESKNNRNFARQNIITKGSIIATELGNAVVLNRPGREGMINAKLV